MTKGYKTSEFWVTVGVQLVGAALATGLIPADHWSAQLAGTVLMAAAAMGYSYSRGKTKSGT